MAEIKPLHDYVLIRRHEAEHKSPGGIVLPDVSQKKPTRGVVVAVGSGRVDRTHPVYEDYDSLSYDAVEIPPTVAPGDEVLFGPYAGSEIEHGGETLVLVREGELMAVIVPAEAALQ